MDSPAPRAARAVALKYKTPKHASCFDRPAAERPYPFVGALQDVDGAVSRVALAGAAADPDAVTADEALRAWALPPDEFFALAEPRTLADVSRAAHKLYKGSLRAFRDAVGEECWDVWDRQADRADQNGVQALLHGARAAATLRDSRRIMLQTALYFAGLEQDEPGLNATAWALRDNKARCEAFVEFVRSGPATRADMTAAAEGVAAAIAKEHAAAGSKPKPAGAKRKRAGHGQDPDPETAKKARRAALLTAFIDAELAIPTVADMTDAERGYLEAGPVTLDQVHDAASALAVQRCEARLRD